MFSSLSCADCNYTFHPKLIGTSCPECGSNSFKSEESDHGLAVRIATTRSYSLSHIQHAALFAKNSGAIEKEYGGDLSGLKFHLDNEAFVTAAIFGAVAFLECTMNEFFSEIGNNKEFLNIYGEETGVMIERLWNWEYPRTAAFPILQKYQIALTLCKKQIFETGNSPYQWVDLLIKLRNYLIHAEPENTTLFTVGKVSGQKAPSDKLAGGLKGKFPINKLMEKTGNPFFPDKCLGHGCAEWGIRSSLKFTDEFFARIGLVPPYDTIRKNLKTTWDDDQP